MPFGAAWKHAAAQLGASKLGQKDNLHRAAMFAIDAAGIGGLEDAEIEVANQVVTAKFDGKFTAREINAEIIKAVEARGPGKQAFAFKARVSQLIPDVEGPNEAQYLIGIMLDVATASGGDVDKDEEAHIRSRAKALKVDLEAVFGIPPATA